MACQRPATKTIDKDDFEEKQKQMRIKYGSNKTKQNYYSSRMGGAAGMSGHSQLVRNSLVKDKPTKTRTTSQCSDRTSNQLSRQKSSTSVTSDRSHHAVSSRLMSGTASSMQRKSLVQE